MLRTKRVRTRACTARPFGRKAGLTIVELLVVLGICVVLGILLVPVLFRSRENARRVVCANNLNSLGQAYAIGLVEANNYLPDAYYAFEGTDGTYQVSLVEPEPGKSGSLMQTEHNQALVCPSDEAPVNVAARGRSGTAIPVGASYAYNIALPLAFDNASRVSQPVNTVTFYDGDASAVVGTWEHSFGWAADTIAYRHRKSANYLFLDGHVENSAGFPDRAFDGGSAWATLFGATAGDGGDSGDDGDDGGSGSGDQVDFTIEDGTVTPNETCTVTIKCLGAAFQYGAGGPRIPVYAYYRIDGGSRKKITSDVLGGETVVLEDVGKDQSISMIGKTTKYVSAYYESDTNPDHCWIMLDGQTVPSIAGFAGQSAIETFLAPYMTQDGQLRLGPSDCIFLFELSSYTDYNKYSCADFQDLVALVTFSKGTTGSGGESDDGGTGSGVAGSLNINPNNNSTFEFYLTLPDGRQVTRDDLHADRVFSGAGFNSEYLEYSGRGTQVRVKPKGNGNQNGLTVDGQPYSLENKNRYIISSNDMTVHLFNSKRNKKGKAMGKWWIDITANNATIEVQ